MSSLESARRDELYHLNIRAWNGEDVLQLPAKLDSSVKKNTSFIKKIKTSVDSEHLQGVIKDIETLSLNKYLSELNQALYDTVAKITKSKDLAAASEIISLLHQRFGGEFTSTFILNVLIGLSNDYNIDDDSIKVSRQKNLLRVLMELTFIGVVRTIRDIDKSLVPDKILKKFNHKDHNSELIILVVLKDLLQFDMESGPYLEVVASFSKRYYSILPSILPEAFVKFETVFRIYSQLNLKILSRLADELNKTITSFNKSTMRHGKVFDDRSEDLDDREKIFNHFHDNMKIICEYIHMEFPEFSIVVNEVGREDGHNTIEVVNGDTSNSTEEALNIWDSPQEKQFYTVVLSLSEIAPANFESNLEKYIGKTDGEKVSLFLESFEHISDENEVENLVLIFNKLGLNNKATVNRLFRFFTESEYSINYRFYTKFLKLNQSNLQQLVDDVVEFLDVKLRSQLRFDRLSFRYIYFYIEFIKFKMIPPFKIFHKLRSLTLNISGTNNIDILTIFAEKCGRFLLFDVDYRENMLNIISLLNEQKKSPDLTISNKLSIKNILLLVELPLAKKQPLKSSMPKMSVKQEFLVRLIKTELNGSNIKDVLKLVLHYNFSVADYHSLIVDLFTSARLVNFDNIKNLIELLKHLSRPVNNQFILIKVVDQLVENIVRNIEINDYRTNRERVLHAKLVNEIYRQRLISFGTVIDLGYKILVTGHPNNQPLPMNYEAEVDLPDNYFKIQLICILLNGPSSIFISSNPNKKVNDSVIRANKQIWVKLHSFMTFFQYYIFCKEPAIPKQIQFQLDDLFEQLCSVTNLKVYGDLMEAVSELKVISESRTRKPKSVRMGMDGSTDNVELAEIEEDLDEDEFLGLGDDEDDLKLSSSDEDSEDESSDDENEPPETLDNQIIPDKEDLDSEEDDIMNSEKPNSPDVTETEIEEHSATFQDRKFESELNREFHNRMVESLQSAQAGIEAHGDRSGPKILLPQTRASQPNNSKFNLLMKKGKNTNVKQIALNDDSVAQRIKEEKLRREQHNKKIMSLVLNMQD